MRIPALVAVTLLALVAVANVGSAATAKPRVWVVDTSPIVVAAAGFGARERVVLTVKAASGARYARTLRATRAGRVEAKWSGSIQVDACHLVVVTAVGAHTGLQATYNSPKPKGGIECPTPVQPVNQ